MRGMQTALEHHARAKLLGLLLCPLMAGCSNSAPVPDGGQPHSGSPDAGTYQLLGATNTVLATDGTPVAGATVCILGYPSIPCATADGAGAYSIQVPVPFAGDAGLDVAMNATAMGYLGTTVLLTETCVPGLCGVISPSFRLLDDTTASGLLGTQAGFAFPNAGRAFVQVSIFHLSGGAEIGTTLSLSPSSPDGGPVYVSDAGVPDPTLTSITAEANAYFGNVPPGNIQVTASGTCVPTVLSADAWASTTPHTISGVATAGSMTFMTLICQ